MRSSALKKQEFFEEVVEVVAPKSWDVRRQHIAQEAEAAAQLSGNQGSPDFEEFLSKYSMNRVSDFA